MSAHDWVLTLLRATFEGGVLLLLIWIVTRLWPRMPAAARCGLWWVGSLRMLIGLIDLPRIPVAWQTSVSTWVPDVRTPMVQLGNAMAGGVAPPVVAVPAKAPMDYIPITILAVWGVGAIIGLAILIRRLIALRRVWHAAGWFEDPRVAAWQAEWAVVLGHGRVPEVRASTDTQVPVAIGALRPGLLLPADSSRLSDNALRMVLAHEMSHVRRGDPLLGWVPAAAQIVFWFSPPVRFAAREYLAAREQVSDADALRATGVSPHDYGALLLDYGVGRVSEVPGVASCGSRGARDLKRRLDMLSSNLRVPTGHPAVAAFITLMVVALAFAPIRFVAANEGKSDARKKSEYDDQWRREKEREAKAQAQYEEQQLEAEAKAKYDQARAMAATRADEKLAHTKAYKQDASRKRPPIAYMVKRKDMKGTRGSVDMMDMESARRIDHDNRTAVYFRLGDAMWISYDERTIEEVLSVIEPEDQFDEKMKVGEGQRQAYERERLKLEERRLDIEDQKRELESRRAALLQDMDEVHPSKKALAEKAAIDDDMQSLWAGEESLQAAMQLLYSRTKAAYDRNQIPFAEREELHRRVLEQVAEVGRRAIEDGRAQHFEP